MSGFPLWHVVAAALFPMVLGWAWYHPRLFGVLWMQDSGMTPEMAERGAKHAHWYELLGLAGFFVVAFVLHVLLQDLHATAMPEAVGFGVLLWLGVASPILLSSVLWEHRPLNLYFINIGFWLVALAVMAGILVA